MDVQGAVLHGKPDQADIRGIGVGARGAWKEVVEAVHSAEVQPPTRRTERRVTVELRALQAIAWRVVAEGRVLRIEPAQPLVATDPPCAALRRKKRVEELVRKAIVYRIVAQEREVLRAPAQQTLVRRHPQVVAIGSEIRHARERVEERRSGDLEWNAART